MFAALLKVINDAKLKGVECHVKAMADGVNMSVMLAFNQSDALDQKLIAEHKNEQSNSNAQDVINLRSLLATPLCIIGKPDELPAMIETALAQLGEGVIAAATTYSSLDISAMLSQAANTVKAKADAAKKTSTAKTSKKAETPVAEPDAELDEELEDDAESEQNNTATSTKVAPQTAQPTQVQTGFDEFDAL